MAGLPPVCWEELWDAALRIRSLFRTTPLPEGLRAALAQPFAARFAAVPRVTEAIHAGDRLAVDDYLGIVTIAP